MKFKKNGGFTLVELIVVIAILAILAGVAVPAYSGYIAKAEKAGDLQLLGAVNQAFGAACLEEGISSDEVVGANIAVTNGKVGAVTSVTVKDPSMAGDVTTPKATALTTEQVEKISDAFARYFAGNEDKVFKVLQSLFFHPEKHCFVDPESIESNETFDVYYNGTPIQVSGETIKAMQDSTYGQVIGGEKLLKEVAALTGWVDAGDGQGILTKLGTEYYAALAKYTGVDDPVLMEAFLNDMAPEDKATITTNGIVLYAAENFGKMTNEQITTLLSSGDIYANLDDDPALQLAQASMVYGLYTGYVNSDYYKGEPVTGDPDPVAAVKTVSKDEEFVKYINSTAGQADLDAYREAMSVINSSTENKEAVLDILQNGYDNEELISLLQQVMGK